MSDEPQIRKRGRPARNYVTKWGEEIVGLGRDRDGRWRLIGSEAVGKSVKFIEPDELRAIEKFRSMVGPPRPVADMPVVILEGHLGDILPGIPEDFVAAYNAAAAVPRTVPGTKIEGSGGVAPRDWPVSARVYEPLVWAWLRQQLRDRPDYVLTRVGDDLLRVLAGTSIAVTATDAIPLPPTSPNTKPRTGRSRSDP